jgi:D-aminopeptidase
MHTPKRRGRDLGLAFPGNPGPFNAITDVPGVRVDMTTLIQGNVRLAPREREADLSPNATS